MSINNLEMAKIFQTKLDQQVAIGATSAWMEANAQNVKYNGGDTVRMPEISTTGLANYDRDKGFNQGAVTLKYRDYTLTQDRGRTFHLDRMDVDESNFIANAGNVMGTFQRDWVIPEIDSYRYSRIAALAKAEGRAQEGYTLDAATILAKLDEDITNIQDVAGENVPLVIIMSTKSRRILNDAKGIERYIKVDEFNSGAVKNKVNTFNDVPILGVPSARMKTAYIFNDGVTAEQKNGGFKPDTDAKDINWIIIPRNVPIAISKTDLPRIFEPSQNLMADAWKIDYRKFHDLWIPHNQLAKVTVNIGG